MHVPFFNYQARFADDRSAIKQIVADVAESDAFILKQRVAELEAQIGQMIGAQHAVAVANGTSALTLALVVLGVGPGADVLTPAFSFISTASTIVHLGARPVFVDISPATGTIDPQEIAARVTPAARAIIPTHLFSALADMAAVVPIARRHSLRVLEDSAVVLGAGWGGAEAPPDQDIPNLSAGLAGDIGLFSFFPAKPLGGIGDGGMIVTNDDALGRACRMLRNHGQDGVTRFLHHLLGYNSRMDEITAAYLSHRLRAFPALLQRRAAIAEVYNRRLAALAPQVLPPPSAAYRRVYYTYVVQAERRDELRAHLAAQGIETQVYYPRPLHLQPAFAYLGHRMGDFPNAERFSARALALPLYPELPGEHVEHVVAQIERFYA